MEEYTVDNTTKCSVFRTFQGWTALSDMIPGQGLLHGADPGGDGLCAAAPCSTMMPEDELCGVAPGRVLPISSSGTRS